MIPAFEEESEIAAAIENARATLDPTVIVVADGGSQDATASRARHAGALVVASGEPRGTCANRAAATVDADVLVFLHADTRLPPSAGDAIRRALADPAFAGGAFRLGFDGGGRTLRLAATLANLRARMLGVVYGDQALFLRRDVFVRLDGFAPWPLWEDADLSRRIAAEGRFALLAEAVATSARRHERHGPLRTCLRIWWLTARFRAGAAPAQLVGSWRPVRRS